MSFTDEQLLNLVNNAILKKTEFKPEDFTGGSVQVTSTNNNKVTNFRASLFFGYKSKKPITRTIEINEDSYYIWGKALMIKVLTLKNKNIGMDFSELNDLMNSSSIVDSKEVVSNIVDSKEVVSKVEVTLPVGLPVEFTFSLKKNTHYINLSKEYKSKLKEEILKIEGDLKYDDFILSLEGNSKYKYINFVSIYKKWNKSSNNKPSQKIDLPLDAQMFIGLRSVASIEAYADGKFIVTNEDDIVFNVASLQQLEYMHNNNEFKG